MVLKTLGKTTWEEIKIGEVFASAGCWCIYKKINSVKAQFIDSDFIFFQNEIEYEFCVGDMGDSRSYELYKLPKSVQRLWKEE